MVRPVGGITGRIGRMMMGCMRHFVHDDQGYRGWLAQHPDGFVINTYSKPSPAYLKLHHASCRTISCLQPPGRTFTEGEYSKLCGGRGELEEHAHRLGGSAQPCPHCL
jgi:hypothetical protein